jgi:hypothetical protein
MPVGSLAWRTPTGAMLWEFWGRHKILFISQGGALLLSCVLAQWVEAFSRNQRDIFIPCAYQAGIFALLQTLTCFCYMEIDTRRQQGGIPGHLLLKPVSTIRLVAVPMFCGSAVVLAVFLAWVGLVWRHIGFPTEQLPWLCAVVISFTWSIQAAAWGFANWPWAIQATLVLLAAGINVFVGLIPALPVSIHVGWRLIMLAALLAGSFSLGWVGVRRVRQGAWENGRGLAVPVGHSAATKPKRFRSAFRAQFWLEWRRQGWSLPFFTAIGQVFAVLAQFVIESAFRKTAGVAMTVEPTEIPVLLSYLILTPLVCSLALGSLIANFDLSQPANELPVFVAVRPVTNGGFVLAKLAMTALSSAATWLVTLGMLFLWLVLCADATLHAQIGQAIRSKPLSIALLLLGSWMTFVLLTWRNLLAGLWLGLTGRPKFATGYNLVRFAVYLGLFILGKQAWDDADSRATSIHWLPWLLVTGLLTKLLFSTAVFLWSLRRKAITAGAVNWIVGSWIGCGLFVAVVVRRVCLDLHQPEAWLWAALAGFFLLPLAEIALAPVALIWNRHR